MNNKTKEFWNYITKPEGYITIIIGVISIMVPLLSNKLDKINNNFRIIQWSYCDNTRHYVDIINNSNHSICEEDFLEDFVIYIEKNNSNVNFTYLGSTVVNQDNMEHYFDNKIIYNKDKIVIKPFLLNSNESLRIILSTDKTSNISIRYRIKNINCQQLIIRGTDNTNLYVLRFCVFLYSALFIIFIIRIKNNCINKQLKNKDKKSNQYSFDDDTSKTNEFL